MKILRLEVGRLAGFAEPS